MDMSTFGAVGLPFSSLNNEGFAGVCSGPRIVVTYRGGSLQEARQLVELRVKVSTSGSRINDFNGCSHFRIAGNYVAGYTKRVLRKSRPKGLPKTAEGFPKLCVELQLNVNACIHASLVNINIA